MKGQGLKVSLIAVWVAATAIFALWLTSDRISALEQKLESDGQILHRLISQRADQHDAHLTGLSALASSNKQPPLDILLNLAETIRRFYPRITSVDLIALRTMKPEVVFSTRQNDVGADLALSIRKAALASTGALQIIPTDSGYLLVKRSPNSDASRFGLALNIDARKLVESDRELSPGTTLKLETQDRRKVFQNEASTEQPPSTGFLQPLGFEKTLGSRSQPLVLSLESRASLAEVLPTGAIVVFAAVAALLLAASAAFLQQREKARDAEKRAVLGEHEARIAQASRINGLGEMASGIAHELNQPLTAILSQSQAGRRVIDASPDDKETVAAVLDAVSQQAKRAGDILSRLRDWSSHEMRPPGPIKLNEVARGIAALMQADLKGKGLAIQLNLGTPAPVILGDGVQIEQVIFNLARNGAEAMDEGQGGTLSVSTRCENGEAVIEVEDQGCGIDPELLPKLLEPFFSTKQDGMGLGLSLCDGIVERFGGRLEIANRGEGGVRATVVFPLHNAATGEASR